MADVPLEPHGRPYAHQLRAGGLGRTSSQASEQVSDELRLGTSPALRRRRQAAGVLLGSCAALGAVGARRLDDVGRTPDALAGLVLHATSAALVATGGAVRGRRRPAVPLALAGKLAADTALAAVQVARGRRAAVVPGLASAAALALMAPEVRAAARS